MAYWVTDVALDQLGGAREYGTAEEEIPFPEPIQKSEVSDCRKKSSRSGMLAVYRGHRTVKTTHIDGVVFVGGHKIGRGVVVDLSRSREVEGGLKGRGKFYGGSWRYGVRNFGGRARRFVGVDRPLIRVVQASCVSTSPPPSFTKAENLPPFAHKLILFILTQIKNLC